MFSSIMESPACFLFSFAASTLSVCSECVLWYVVAAVMRLTSQWDDNVGRSLDKSRKLMRAIKSLTLGRTHWLFWKFWVLHSSPSIYSRVTSRERRDREEEEREDPAPSPGPLEQRNDEEKRWVRLLSEDLKLEIKASSYLTMML